MAGIDLATAETKLQTWLDAEDRVALGQTVEMNGRKLSLADLEKVQAQVEYWNRKVLRMSRGASVSAQRVIIRG